MIVTDDEAYYERMNSLRNVGRIKGGEWYEHHYLGCNYRITQFQAALLSQQLRRLDSQTRTRDANGRYLTSLLASVKGIKPLIRSEHATLHTYHLYILRYDKAAFGGLAKKRICRHVVGRRRSCFYGISRTALQATRISAEEFSLLCHSRLCGLHQRKLSCY